MSILNPKWPYTPSHATSLRDNPLFQKVFAKNKKKQKVVTPIRKQS